MTTATLRQRRRRHRCTRKILYRTLEAAETNVAERVKQVIYDRLVPQAYRCAHGQHWHVGHSLKRREATNG